MSSRSPALSRLGVEDKTGMWQGTVHGMWQKISEDG